MEERYLAQFVGSVCETSVSRHAIASLPSQSPSSAAQIAEARKELEHACSRFYGVQLDELRRENKRLLSDTLASPTFSRQFSASDDEAASKAAIRERVYAGMQQYGLTSLLWNAENLVSIWTEGQSSEREISPDDRLLHAGAVAAMCYGSVPCDGSGLIYLNLCGNAGICGGSVLGGLTEGLAPEQAERVEMIAKSISIQARQASSDALFRRP